MNCGSEGRWFESIDGTKRRTPIASFFDTTQPDRLRNVTVRAAAKIRAIVAALPRSKENAGNAARLFARHSR
jgi:hypothetical protein